MFDYYCDFSNPVDYQGNAPALPTDLWQFKNSTCVASSSPATSSIDQFFIGGFSAGEIVNSIFLFLITLLLAYSFLFFWVRGIKIKKF